jgi:hypothetical protein
MALKRRNLEVWNPVSRRKVIGFRILPVNQVDPALNGHDRSFLHEWAEWMPVAQSQQEIRIPCIGPIAQHCIEQFPEQIQPAQMTPDELYRGFKWAYRETFRLPRIARRISRPDLRCPINFVGNLCYRIFVRRLYREPRFALPYSADAPGLPPEPHHWQAPAELEEALCGE